MDLQRLLAAMPGTNYHAVWIPVESVKQRREAAIAALAAKQEKEEEPEMATVHHRRVVVGPTLRWYQERQGSHNRKDATCAARNMPHSLAEYSAAA